MKTLTRNLNLTTLSIAASLFVALTLSASSMATPIKISAKAEQVIEQHFALLEQQQQRSDQALEQEQTQAFEMKLAKVESEFVSKKCKQHDLTFDKETSTCIAK